MNRNRRPLVVGVLASGTCCAMVVGIALLGDPGYKYLGMWLAWPIAFVIGSLAAAIVGVPLVIWLRRRQRLTAILICASGVLAGAMLLGGFNGWLNYWPQMLDQGYALAVALQSAGRTAMHGAVIGLISAVGFCWGAGIPNRRRRI